MFKNTEEMKIVFTAQSKQFFYCRDAICAYVLAQGFLPLNPFRIFDYFLGERVDRNLIRRGNNNLVRVADELWVFGIVADGVLFEIDYALSMKKTIRFFTINARPEEIMPIDYLEEVKFESPIHASGRRREELLHRIDPSYPYHQLSLLTWASVEPSMQDVTLPISSGVIDDDIATTDAFSDDPEGEGSNSKFRDPYEKDDDDQAEVAEVYGDDDNSDDDDEIEWILRDSPLRHEDSNG